MTLFKARLDVSASPTHFRHGQRVMSNPGWCDVVWLLPSAGWMADLTRPSQWLRVFRVYSICAF